MKRPDWMPEAVSLGMVLLIVVSALLIFRSCRRAEDLADKLPPAVVTRIDSLDRTKPEFQARTDSILRVVIFDTARAVAFRRAEERAKLAASSAERRADSLAKLATTAQEWHAAYDARTSEADTLKMALARADSVAEAERSARRSLAVAYEADTLRRVALDHLTQDLRDAIKKLEKPCRVVGPIPCPSRSASAGLALLAGALAGRKL